jgi:hypothetical protein
MLSPVFGEFLAALLQAVADAVHAEAPPQGRCFQADRLALLVCPVQQAIGNAPAVAVED